MANLVDKSLLAADIGSNTTYYRLLELTRTYALQLLQDSGERKQVIQRHADYYRELFVRAGSAAAARTKAEWAADYGREIDNLRVALDWALSANGNNALGVVLAAAASDFWIAMSLLSECCDWGYKAIATAWRSGRHARRIAVAMQPGTGADLQQRDAARCQGSIDARGRAR